MDTISINFNWDITPNEDFTEYAVRERPNGRFSYPYVEWRVSTLQEANRLVAERQEKWQKTIMFILKEMEKIGENIRWGRIRD